MNSVHFLAIVSTPIYIPPVIVRFPTVEDTSYNTFITAIPSLFLYHTLNPVQSFGSILPVEISPRVQGPGTLTLIRNVVLDVDVRKQGIEILHGPHVRRE